MSRSKLSDPYSSLPADTKEKIQTWLPLSEKLLLLGIDPFRGTMQSTINSLLKGLIDELRANGITSYDRIDDFHSIVKRRSAPPELVNRPGASTPIGNVRGGSPDSTPENPVKPNKRASTTKRSAKRAASETGGEDETNGG